MEPIAEEIAKNLGFGSTFSVAVASLKTTGWEQWC